jgi:hypothetical protein
MAIYRPAGRRPIVLAALGALAVGVVVGAIAGRISAPDTGAALSALAERTAAIDTTLTVVRFEYPKLVNGSDDPGASESGVQRALAEFEAIAPDLALIDASATESARGALLGLRQLIVDRQPIEVVQAAADELKAQLATIIHPPGSGI